MIQFGSGIWLKLAPERFETYIQQPETAPEDVRDYMFIRLNEDAYANGTFYARNSMKRFVQNNFDSITAKNVLWKIRIGEIFNSNDFGALRSIRAEGMEPETEHLNFISKNTSPAFLDYFFQNFANDEQRKLGLQTAPERCIGYFNDDGYNIHDFTTVDNADCLAYMLDRLNDYGLDPNKITNSTDRLLLAAARTNAHKCARLLIDRGVKPTTITYERTINAVLRRDNADLFKELYDSEGPFIGIGPFITKDRSVPNATEVWCDAMNDPDNTYATEAHKHIEDWFFQRNPVKYLNLATHHRSWFRTLNAIAEFLKPEKLTGPETMYGWKGRSRNRTKAEAVCAFRQSLDKIRRQHPKDLFGD